MAVPSKFLIADNVLVLNFPVSMNMSLKIKKKLLINYEKPANVALNILSNEKIYFVTSMFQLHFGWNLGEILYVSTLIRLTLFFRGYMTKIC